MKHIRLKDLSVGYDSQIVVDKINISFMQGKMTCILGPNGSGKTTVLKTIANIISQISGVVEIAGTDLDDFKIRRTGQGNVGRPDQSRGSAGHDRI